MIDNKYIGVLDNQDKRWYDSMLHSKHKGDERGALEEILKDLDCTKVYDCGRPTQTINYGYRRDIAAYYYILENIKDNKPLYEEYLNKLYTRHAENLSFEEGTPPIRYNQTKQRTSSRTINRTATIKDVFTGAETTVDVGSGRVIKTRENAKIRKAKALNDRSVSFAFNNFKVSK